MSRSLELKTEADVIGEVKRLRRGYRQTANWNLAQICWHVNAPLANGLTPPSATTPDDEQRKAQDYLQGLSKAGRMPQGLVTSAALTPAKDVGDGAIDAFIDSLNKLAAYPHPFVAFGRYGPVPIGLFREFICIHATHHLQFLEPTSPQRRANVAYRTEEDVIADIEALRQGYEQAGNWNLAQVCWHCDAVMKARMNPPPTPAPTTPEQAAKRPMFEQILKTGQLPDGIASPDAFVPPDSASDADVDACVATLRTFKGYAGPVGSHRIFGALTLDEAKKLNLIHCARHLSFLTPTSKKT